MKVTNESVTCVNCEESYVVSDGSTRYLRCGKYEIGVNPSSSCEEKEN